MRLILSGLGAHRGRDWAGDVRGGSFDANTTGSDLRFCDNTKASEGNTKSLRY